MISAGTFHVISTELTIGMFALSGVAFLLCAIQKGPISRESVAHWALLGGLIATPFAIVSGVNAVPGGGMDEPILANKLLLSMTSAGLAVGILLRRKWGGQVNLRHSSIGMLSVGLMLVTAGMGGEYSRGETLLLFIPKETVMLFPTWASIVLLIIGVAIVGKSTIEHRA
ncbi:MAG: hypothetical protein CMB28_01480 [Euryarchaeota archaeon]|nr:hypothetical protein [Euryarchaeota archaeon]|tara:strand:+ start:5702 stop:6211 length:510 start_codon:yes stop_codon:yes gene_type:complete